MSFFRVVAASEPNTKSQLSLPTINLNNGLLEITALTTLVGSGVAVSLAFGSRGPAGLAWAPMSAFGMLGTIRACFCGASPGWLRETLSLRTAVSDAVIGMELDLDDSRRTGQVRSRMGEPLGIVCDAKEAVLDHNGCEKEVTACRDVYSFDHSTSAMISKLPDTRSDKGLRVFSYANYGFMRNHNAKLQLAALTVSLGKLAEIYVLWISGGNYIGLISSLPWLYFFLVAVIVETQEIILRRRPMNKLGNLDIITGKLPKIGLEPGPRKVILGAYQNSMSSVWWRIIWAGGAIICLYSLIFLYFLLGKQPNELVFTWIGFQVLWLILRIFLYHHARPEDPLFGRVLLAQPLESLPQNMKDRVLRLVIALSKYLVHVHPRGQYSYQEDCFSPKDLASLRTTLISYVYPLQPFPQNITASNSLIKLHILGVIGDATLSSASWIMGDNKLTPLDVYDSCILILSIPTTKGSLSPNKTIFIPAIRVLSGRSMTSTSDIEGYGPLFIPKGAGNSGANITWMYWVPFEGRSWLHFTVGVNMTKLIGDHEARILDDQQVTAQLTVGNLNISISHVDDVKRILKISQHAAELLVKFLS